MAQSAKGRALARKSANEIDGEGELLESYAGKLPMPTFAYIRRIWFRKEFRNNRLPNRQMRDALAKCIFAGGKEGAQAKWGNSSSAK